jgi:hypothetical protein
MVKVCGTWFGKEQSLWVRKPERITSFGNAIPSPDAEFLATMKHGGCAGQERV